MGHEAVSRDGVEETKLTLNEKFLIIDIRRQKKKVFPIITEEMLGQSLG